MEVAKVDCISNWIVISSEISIKINWKCGHCVVILGLLRMDEYFEVMNLHNTCPQKS